MVGRIVATSFEQNRPIWFDTMAVIAYFKQTHQYALALRHLLEHPAVLCGISAITLAESLAGPARFGDELGVRRMRSGLFTLPRLIIAPLDNETAEITAWVRVQTGLKLPDAGIIASARRARAVCIIGNDQRWREKSLGLPLILLDELI